ncbi:MAG: hypothetical protein ACREBQ_08200 [Nitrososphaerales archaeon]
MIELVCRQCEKAGVWKEFEAEVWLEDHLKTAHGLTLHKETKRQGLTREATSGGLFTQFLGKQVSILLRSGKNVHGTLVELSNFDLLLEDGQHRRFLCPKHSIELLALQEDMGILGSEARGKSTK